MKLSWKPVRRGTIYCASACGGSCTWVEYTQAVRRSLQLARRMGEGWKPKVWENLGWHYCVMSPCGRIKVHPGYTAYLGGGRWCEQGKTPELAVLKVIRAAKHSLAQINAVLKGL